MRFRLEGNGPESHQVRRAAGVFRVSSYLFQLRPLYPCCSLREVFDFLKTVRSPEHRLAWLVAIAADAIQIGALPLFAAGGLSPADALLDLGVAAILIRLLGWHWAFLPTLLAELVPGFDLFPDLDCGGFLRDSAAGSLRGAGVSASKPRSRASKLKAISYLPDSPIKQSGGPGFDQPFLEPLSFSSLFN